MRIKTSNLTGAALDWAVMLATANGVLEPGPNYWLEKWLDPDRRGACEAHSTNWLHGGPIVEREKITVEYMFGADADRAWQAWTPIPDPDPDHEAYGLGHTPLIAAMRCFVRSKLGDEVEIPKELT